MVTLWIVAFVGVFLGCLLRLLLPFLRKLREEQNLKFDWKYVLNMAIALVISAVAAGLVLSSSQITEMVAGGLAAPVIFFAAFAAGWASTDLVNEISSTGTHTLPPAQ